MVNLRLSSNKIFYLIFFGTLIFLACSKPKIDNVPMDQIIAQVGDQYITVDQFRISYEQSFPIMRQGEKEPRYVYLDHMINELLLASKGFDEGYDKSPYVSSRINRRQYQDLLESFYTKYVYSRVAIPEDELQEATKKSSVKFRLMFWPTPSLDDAKNAYEQAVKSDLENFIDNELAKQETKLQFKEFFQTDWIDFLELPPRIFDQLADLEIGVPSQPLPLGNGYALFQVMDVNFEGLTSEEVKHGIKRKKMEQRLKNIETDRIAHAVMDSVLTPMDIRVKGPVINRIAPLLYQWFQDGLPKSKPLLEHVNTPDDTAKQYIFDLKELLNEALVTTSSGIKTVSDLLDYLNYYRSSLNQPMEYDLFREMLITQIGTMIKNDAFVNIAKNEGFLDSTKVHQDLRIWRDKWTFDITRYEMIKDYNVTENEMKEYFKNRYTELGIADVDTTRFYKYENEIYNRILHEKHLQEINNKLDGLKKQYPIVIHYNVLDTLNLNEGKKEKFPFFLRNNFSGEAVAPTVDLKWLYYN